MTWDVGDRSKEALQRLSFAEEFVHSKKMRWQLKEMVWASVEVTHVAVASLQTSA